MSNPCQALLDLAATCVAADPTTCSCQPSPFPDAFPSGVSDAYKMAMAFYQPEDDGFCDEANSNVCAFTDTLACCCADAVQAYTACTYQNDLNLKFGVAVCNYSCGGAAGGADGATEGGLSMVMMGIIGAVILLSCLCGGGFYLRRRRRQQVSKGASKDTETMKSDDNDIEVGISLRNNGFTDSDSADESLKGGKSGNMKQSNAMKGFDDSDSSDDDGSAQSGRSGELKKHGSKHGFDESDSSDDDRSHRSGRSDKKKDRSPKREFDDSDSEDDDGRSKSRRSGKLKKCDSKFEDSDSFDNDRSRSSGRSGTMNKRGSNRGFDDSDSSDDDRSRRSGKSGQEHRAMDDNLLQRAVLVERTNPAQVEESVRQARTILSVYETSQKDQGPPSQIHTAMSDEMNDLLLQLRAQRDEMEARLRLAENKAMELSLEKEAANKRICELETHKSATENRLQVTEAEAKIALANSKVEIAAKESEKIKLSAELESIRFAREDMTNIIERLEAAKTQMRKKLKKAKAEAEIHRSEKEECAKRVSEVEKEREALKRKLLEINSTRKDVESKLAEAKAGSAALKLNAREIVDFKSSHGDNSASAQQIGRKKVSKEVRRIDQEAEEMKAMLANLEASRNDLERRLQDSQVQGDDISINIFSACSERSVLTHASSTSRYVDHGARQASSMKHSEWEEKLAQDQAIFQERQLARRQKRQSRDKLGGSSSSLGRLPEDNHASWLIQTIQNRSCNNLDELDRAADPPTTQAVGQKKARAKHGPFGCDPSVDGTDIVYTDSASVLSKREKLRESEQKLIREISKSKLNSNSNRSLKSTGD